MKLDTTSAPPLLEYGHEYILVRTNCPTVAEKPDRKALKGCMQVSIWYVSHDAPGTYVVASKHTVEELESSDGHEEDEEDVNQLGALGGILDVVVVDVLQHLIPAIAAALLSLWLRGRGGCGSAGLRSNSGRGGDVAGVLLGRHDSLSIEGGD